MPSKRGKAWPLHSPGRKDTMGISEGNRLKVVESSVVGFIPIPLKRKYLTYRSYTQTPANSPANPARKNARPFWPMGRIRAIKSSLAG